jgi:two-component system cell cycle sensor histidine kinase/response regulator CckA
VGEILRTQGLKVLAAETGAAGVALYRQTGATIGLVILDRSMPGMGGEEAIRELRKIDPGARVVLSSGYGREEATRGFEGLGLSGFIQKPCKPEALLAEVRRHLGRS